MKQIDKTNSKEFNTKCNDAIKAILNEEGTLSSRIKALRAMNIKQLKAVRDFFKMADIKVTDLTVDNVLKGWGMYHDITDNEKNQYACVDKLRMFAIHDDEEDKAKNCYCDFIYEETTNTLGHKVYKKIYEFTVFVPKTYWTIADVINSIKNLCLRGETRTEYLYETAYETKGAKFVESESEYYQSRATNESRLAEQTWRETNAAIRQEIAKANA